MTDAYDVARRGGRTLAFAFLVAPAGWPVQELLASGTELAGIVAPNWLLLRLLLVTGFVLAETYEGPDAAVFPTAILTVALFVGFRWIVGLNGLNVISMRVLVANALVYVAAVSCAVVIVFETDARERVAALIGRTDSRSEPA